ncbi:tellurite resistance/C4-dicarboxylate transporter family protein [Gordonia zhaorongruii]|uniref:tellurite resistance/C4-dicarboxylate transporter family protein n=1 Tax=Gordonia zhaorongruii TaxID=2597659 RepID=UPI001F320560|nr:tellurite resistance/C4-dicarboxylate transporter family protein [Gordonia zhaorongruii]
MTTTGSDGMVRNLDPGYFSMVMATGIVSVAAHLQGWTMLSSILLWIACAGYAILVALNLVRLSRHSDAVVADLAGAGRTFGFFTFVAATAVIGTRLVIADEIGAAAVLLGLAGAAWLVLGYVLPACAFGSRGGGRALREADGSWFIWTVATQSVAVLSATLAPHVDSGRAQLALLAVACWAVGAFLYLATAVLVAARILLYRPDPREVSGAYWVAMGATAITVVAGMSIDGMHHVPILEVTGGAIAALSVLFWAFGTWLIPPLMFLGYWRHRRSRVPLRYEVSLWAIVFPLGMYGVASRELGLVHDLPILDAIGHVEIWVALAAWSVTFIGMLAAWGRALASRPSPTR